jgi:tetratricopeptide (TPR) repeat protein
LADANSAVENDPKIIDGYLVRGTIYFVTGKLRAALADFDRTLALNPKIDAPYGERGQTYLALGQFDKALVDFDRALSINTANDDVRALRGLTLLLKGDSAEGLVDIRHVLDRNPNNTIAQIGQGLAMLLSGQTDRALVALNQVVGRSGTYDVLARTLRARALLAKEDTAGAMAEINTALGNVPDDPDALLLRSLILVDMGNYDQALEDLDKAIAKHETVENRYVRAKVHEAQNKLEKALEDYRQATKIAAGSVFDVEAQAEALQKVQQLAKKLPCRGVGTCL